MKPVIAWKLRLIALLSTLLCAFNAEAHEVQPAIADLTLREGKVWIELNLNLESYLSGIDLDGLFDTDDAAQSREYDRLRGLGAGELAAEVPALIGRWNGVPMVSVNGEPVILSAIDVMIPPVGNESLPRPSRLVLVGEASGPVVVTWPKGAGDLVLRQQGVIDPYTGYLSGGQSAPELRAGQGDGRSGWAVFAEYIPVGFDHIVPKGLDHILFVLGIFFLAQGWRALLWQVTAFTAAHTVTLALGALGLVTVPGAIVEPLIAASIVFVAVENIIAPELRRWRTALVFGFGLLHGLGFASVLGEFGLPEGAFIAALIGFNVGVEIGQLAVIAAAALLIALAARLAQTRAPRFAAYGPMYEGLAVPVSLVIALIAAWWTFERVFL